MALPISASGQVRNFGYYDAFPYKFWGYPRLARNYLENNPLGRQERENEDRVAEQRLNEEQELNQSLEKDIGLDANQDQDYGGKTIGKRLLRPRYLCFVEGPDERGNYTTVLRKVADWLAENRVTQTPDYLFISYTSTQFGEEDFPALLELAVKATLDAGLQAYWIGCSCMAEESELENDVYRISDVLRGAASLAIIVGHPIDGRDQEFTSYQLLEGLGQRMWTMPELLLGPRGRWIQVFTRGVSQPFTISKGNIAQLVWPHDAPISRQLIDHYEGTILLSSLELVVLALRCLKSRHTSTHLPGDLAYALMGLLRRRPRINRTDSAFQAFASLSLANDSNMLLERLVCIQPKDLNKDWHQMNDFWDVQLWDIYPTCQVAGVDHDDTVLLDGAFGAAIRWKSFAPVAYLVRDTWKRSITAFLVRVIPLIIFPAIYLTSISTGARPVGILLLVIVLPILFASPYLICATHSGKLWGTQAWFFGFEGYLDIQTIESHIFGMYTGRLTWSPSGSSLSCHRRGSYDECIGQDPTTDPEVNQKVQSAQNSSYGEEKIFTLVDTYTMTVTMFAAVRPPVAVLLCGHEGGMQRAVLCSYESKTQTLYRETVLRMETPVLQKMVRVGRFRFGFNRPLSTPTSETDPK